MDILKMFEAIETNPAMLQQLAASGQDPQQFIHALRQSVAQQSGGGIGGVLPTATPQPAPDGVGQALV